MTLGMNDVWEAITRVVGGTDEGTDDVTSEDSEDHTQREGKDTDVTISFPIEAGESDDGELNHGEPTSPSLIFFMSTAAASSAFELRVPDSRDGMIQELKVSVCVKI